MLLEQTTNTLSAIHINIRCINKIVDNLKSFLATCCYDFISIISLTETWCKDKHLKITHVFNYQITM